MKTRNLRGCLVMVGCLTAACSGLPTEPTNQPPTALTVSLRSDAWQTISNPAAFPLSNGDDAHLVFEFPTEGSMHYLFTPSARPDLRGTLVVSLRVTTSGPVLFNSLDPLTSICRLPPSVRPFFWANANGSGDYDRWWSNPQSYVLADGAATIAVPLQPEHWSSVQGRYGNADSEVRYAFARALLNVSRLGLTFGGGCSFGHGINVAGGTAQFRLTSYAIQ